jgi:hypothetical protein
MRMDRCMYIHTKESVYDFFMFSWCAFDFICHAYVGRRMDVCVWNLFSRPLHKILMSDREILSFNSWTCQAAEFSGCAANPFFLFAVARLLCMYVKDTAPFRLKKQTKKIGYKKNNDINSKKKHEKHLQRQFRSLLEIKNGFLPTYINTMLMCTRLFLFNIHKLKLNLVRIELNKDSKCTATWVYAFL